MDAFVSKGKGVKQQSINLMTKKGEPMVHSICRFLYGHALPFVLVKSPLFFFNCGKCAEYGKGLKHSSYHEAWLTFLKKEVDNVSLMPEKHKKRKGVGCTLMSDR